jgi:hypothetical protein
VSDVTFKFSKGGKKWVEKHNDVIWVNWKMTSSGEPHNRMTSLWKVTIFDIYGKQQKLKSKQSSWCYLSIYTLKHCTNLFVGKIKWRVHSEQSKQETMRLKVCLHETQIFVSFDMNRSHLICVVRHKLGRATQNLAEQHKIVISCKYCIQVLPLIPTA